MKLAIIMLFTILFLLLIATRKPINPPEDVLSNTGDIPNENQ